MSEKPSKASSERKNLRIFSSENLNSDQENRKGKKKESEMEIMKILVLCRMINLFQSIVK